MKSTSKKTISGAVIQLEPKGKKTRQGQGSHSRPRGTRKLSRGQGK